MILNLQKFIVQFITFNTHTYIRLYTPIMYIITCIMHSTLHFFVVSLSPVFACLGINVVDEFTYSSIIKVSKRKKKSNAAMAILFFSFFWLSFLFACWDCNVSHARCMHITYTQFPFYIFFSFKSRLLFHLSSFYLICVD